MEVQDVQIKGTALVPFQAYVRERFGDEALRTLLTRLAPADQDAFRGVVLPIGWYPFRIALAAVDVVAELGGDAVLREMAFHNLDYATRNIFKVLFKLGSPQFMVARSDRVWTSYYSAGRMSVPVVKSGYAEIVVHDFPCLTPRYRQVLLHSIEAVVEKAGGKVASAETRDVPSADAGFVVTWS